MFLSVWHIQRNIFSQNKTKTCQLVSLRTSALTIPREPKQKQSLRRHYSPHTKIFAMNIYGEITRKHNTLRADKQISMHL